MRLTLRTFLLNACRGFFSNGFRTLWQVSLRDPVKRAYSHYWHFSSGLECSDGGALRRAPECFHASAVAQIDALRACHARALRRGGAETAAAEEGFAAAPLAAAARVGLKSLATTSDREAAAFSLSLQDEDSEAWRRAEECAWGDRTSPRVRALRKLVCCTGQTFSQLRALCALCVCDSRASDDVLLRRMLLRRPNAVAVAATAAAC